MSHFNNTYDLEKEESGKGLKFFFVSKGNNDIIKVIQYSFVEEWDGKAVYNLGFGDYDIDNDSIFDSVNTNNGDIYRVFNTVLSTIPVFFKNFESAALMVQGSDGIPTFIETCKTVCVKKCGAQCRNYNRRINIYRYYIDKNYETLSLEYQFLGGFIAEDGEISLESYECEKKYNSILLFRKNA